MPQAARTTAVFPADGDEVAVLAVLRSIEHGEAVLAPHDLAVVASKLRDAPRTIRRHAGGALAAFARSSPEARAPVAALLAHEHPHVRWGAAYALAKAGLAGDDVTAVAIATLEDEDGDHRWAAASIVVAAARTSPSWRARLRELAETGGARGRKMALLCLCEAGDLDGALFRAALGDDDAYVRLAALTCLGRAGDRSTESIDAITRIAAHDPDARVQRGAGAILGKLTGSRGQAP